MVRLQANGPNGEAAIDQFFEVLAMDAIEAMREHCTQGMRIAGHAALDASDASEEAIGSKIGFAALGEAWRAMIDDALSRT